MRRQKPKIGEYPHIPVIGWRAEEARLNKRIQQLEAINKELREWGIKREDVKRLWQGAHVCAVKAANGEEGDWVEHMHNVCACLETMERENSKLEAVADEVLKIRDRCKFYGSCDELDEALRACGKLK